jgi:hypothetical protein
MTKTALQVALTVAGIVGIFNAVGVAEAAQKAPQKKEEISFELVPNPAFVECLRANWNHEPRARATVIRGELNDTLILDLDNIKPGLDFDLFTVQHSPFFTDGVKDPSFKGSFGLAWYQSDIEIPKRSDDGRVQIKTILLDQIFGFDPDVNLGPTNTFHLGFWFNNPEDAQPCSSTPIKPTPFNGEHKAGPLAMISTTNVVTRLGPLCTDPTGKTPPSCNP